MQIYEKAIPTETKFYDRNQVIKSYNNLEPRFSIRYELKENQSVKVSYNRMVQYLQLISKHFIAHAIRCLDTK